MPWFNFCLHVVEELFVFNCQRWPEVWDFAVGEILREPLLHVHKKQLNLCNWKQLKKKKNWSEAASPELSLFAMWKESGFVEENQHINCFSESIKIHTAVKLFRFQYTVKTFCWFSYKFIGVETLVMPTCYKLCYALHETPISLTSGEPIDYHHLEGPSGYWEHWVMWSTSNYRITCPRYLACAAP